jgi:HEAT repeat protein
MDRGTAPRVDARRQIAPQKLCQIAAHFTTEVRLAAVEALVKLGEAQKAAGILIAACVGTDPNFRARARPIIRGANDPRPFVATLVGQVRDKDARRRDEAFQTLLLIASPEAVRSALDFALAEDDGEIHQWAAARLKRITASP